MPNRIFPKLHFLETHCLEWIEKYPFRMGLFSEQGSESLHAYVRILEIRFHGIPNEEKKIKSLMQKYLYQVSPSLIALFLKIKKMSKRKSKCTKTSGQAATATTATGSSLSYFLNFFLLLLNVLPFLQFNDYTYSYYM